MSDAPRGCTAMRSLEASRGSVHFERAMPSYDRYRSVARWALDSEIRTLDQ
jgi:hypothetical protein